MAVKKKTFSMPDELFQAALKRSEAMGYESFSAYLTYLIEEDIRHRPAHVLSVVRQEPGVDRSQESPVIDPGSNLKP